MNRREALQAGLGLAVGAVVPMATAVWPVVHIGLDLANGRDWSAVVTYRRAMIGAGAMSVTEIRRMENKA